LEKKDGVEGLKTKQKPGRKGKLSPEDMEKLIKLLKQKDYWTTREVKELIKNEFGIEYTLRHNIRILKKLAWCIKSHLYMTIEDLTMLRRF